MIVYHRTMLVKSKLIVLAAGGTGGHIFPAEALAEELYQRGYKLVLITDHRGASSWQKKETDLTVHVISASKVSGFSNFFTLRGAVKSAFGIIKALFLIYRLRPAVVVGFGGYASVPPMLASILAGYPVAIHEQNAVFGRANRLLAHWANQVAVTFLPTTAVRPARGNILHTGMPVRRTLQKIENFPYVPPHSTDVIRILVIGGSQGAHIFSEVVPTALGKLPLTLRDRLRISQQVRPEDHTVVASTYARLGLIVELAAFFDDIATRLANAHLVISRSGASTVAELALVGRPAILVPYPYATDDHQTANAYAMTDGGGAWLIPQNSFKPEILARRVQTLLTLPDRLAETASRARRHALPDATQRLADMIESLIKYPANSSKDNAPKF